MKTIIPKSIKLMFKTKKGAFTLAWLGALIWSAMIVAFFTFIVLIFLGLYKLIFGGALKGLTPKFKKFFK